MCAQFDQRAVRLEAQAQSAVANILWLAQWGLADLDATARVRIAEAEQHTLDAGMHTEAIIRQEHLHAEAVILCAETWAEEMVDEIEDCLHAAMEDADQYLEYACQLMLVQSEAEGELTEVFEAHLKDTVQTSADLHERTSSLQKWNKALQVQVQRAQGRAGGSVSYGDKTGSRESHTCLQREGRHPRLHLRAHSRHDCPWPEGGPGEGGGQCGRLCCWGNCRWRRQQSLSGALH